MIGKYKISSILNAAADYHLSSGTDGNPKTTLFSCHAVEYACRELLLFSNNRRVKTIEFLESLVGPEGLNFYYYKEERQGARYLWLKFAALVAEDEGL